MSGEINKLQVENCGKDKMDLLIEGNFKRSNECDKFDNICLK